MTRARDKALTYDDRLRRLVERKLAQTREKVERFGPMDEDDLGIVAPPEGFEWKPIPNHPNGSFYGPAGWAENFASLLAVHPTYVDPLDALAGRWMFFLNRMRPAGWPPEFPTSHLSAVWATYDLTPGVGGSSHFGPDYTIGLELGWGGLLEKVRRSRRRHGPDKQAFLQAEEDVILAVQGWMRRTVADIRAAREAESRPELAANLAEMAEVNEWVADHPPRTLREACQWIAWFNMASRIYNRDGAGGQLDELLRPYYQRDVDAGRIDDEDAIFLIACLLLNETHYYQLGGPGPDGSDLTSHVSYLILEAAHRLGIANNLTVRVHDGMDERFFLTAVGHLMRDRKGWPRFAGDKGLVEGFVRNGYSAELARRRIAVGCHWMAIPGREYTLNDLVKINCAKVFEVAFREMVDDPTAEPSVEELWRRYEKHLHRAVKCLAEGFDLHLAHQKDNEPELMLNLLCHGPIEKGVDVTDGGVEYYNLCIDGTGLATVADSFAALAQRVECEGVLTWPEIAAHVRDDYAGREGARVRAMMASAERYGRGGSLGDEWAVRVSELLTRLVKERPTPGGRIMIPGWFSWSRTIVMGQAVGATPDGRGAGEPISFGANPQTGFRADGAPTAM
ncbi:MAG: pyruvate formate lyase family protein, partial [Planctomycetota bacterium]